LNGIGVLDKDTNLFKWFYVGAMHHQHSPRYYKQNRILVFDNYGGRIDRGLSRILSVDVGSGETRIIYPPDGAELPPQAFLSVTAGHLDIHPSQTRLLTAWTHQGTVWEIDITSGEVLWEFTNTHPVSGKPARASVYTAKYVDDLAFPLNGVNPH
jgi:hypothetical protein